jgi:hypothetical protein
MVEWLHGTDRDQSTKSLPSKLSSMSAMMMPIALLQRQKKNLA